MWKYNVGSRIREQRKKLGLSRNQFGELVGVTGQYIGRIERGSHNITGAIIAKVCNATGVTADYIIFGVDIPSLPGVFEGLTNEQIGICLDLLKRVAELINTENGNNALIQEVLRQQHRMTIE